MIFLEKRIPNSDTELNISTKMERKVSFFVIMIKKKSSVILMMRLYRLAERIRQKKFVIWLKKKRKMAIFLRTFSKP